MTLQHLDTFIAFAVVMLGISILITTLTQMVSAFLGYRGTNLRWGLVQLLKSIDPSLEVQAETIAQKVLTHPLISDSNVSRFARLFVKVPMLGGYLGRLHLASAIRVDELIGILQMALTDPSLSKEIKIALAGLLAKVDPDAGLVDTVANLLPPTTPAANQAVEQILKSGRQKVGSLEAWFSSAMDRVGQRFAMQMRIWTIAFAFALAIGMHLDAIRLLSQLSSNAGLRASLVSSSGAMLNLSAESASAAAGAPEIYTKAMQKLKDTSANSLPDIPPLKSKEEAIGWLRQNVKGDGGLADNLAMQYGQILDADLKAARGQLADQAGSVQEILGQADFQLIPQPYPYPVWNFSKDNLFGIFITAVLLSLGAPFWFNALKTLCTLRPVLATNEKQEAKAAMG